jgi:hypothetical protein
MTRVGGFAELDRPPRAEDMRCAPGKLTSLHYCVVSVDGAAAVDRRAALALRALLSARGYTGRQ